MRQALERKESRGLHYTVDYPHPSTANPGTPAEPGAPTTL